MNDLADLAFCGITVVIVNDARLDVQHRPTSRPDPNNLVARSEDRSDRRHLGLSIEVPRPHSGQVLLDLAQHLDRHPREAVQTLVLLREARDGRLHRGAVRPRVDIDHPLLARRFELRPGLIGRPEVVIGGQQVGLRDPDGRPLPPLLCGSAGTHVAIITRNAGRR